MFGFCRVSAQGGKNRVSASFCGLDGFVDRGDVGQDRNSQFVFNSSQPVESAIFLTALGAIDRYQAGAGFHHFLRGFKRGSNQDLSVILLCFPDSNDGYSDGLPNRPDIIRTVGADPHRPTLHSGPRKTRHGRGIPEGAIFCGLARHQEFSSKRGWQLFGRVHEILTAVGIAKGIIITLQNPARPPTTLTCLTIQASQWQSGGPPIRQTSIRGLEKLHASTHRSGIPTYLP